MTKKLLSITVKGNHHEWSFNFYDDPKYIQEWRDDGLEIDEICNTIPEWVVSFKLVKQWVFLQDLFNFKNPFTASKHNIIKEVEDESHD